MCVQAALLDKTGYYGFVAPLTAGYRLGGNRNQEHSPAVLSPHSSQIWAAPPFTRAAFTVAVLWHRVALERRMN